MTMSKLFEADTGRARVCRQQGKTELEGSDEFRAERPRAETL